MPALIRSAWHWLTAPYHNRVQFEREMGLITQRAEFLTEQSLKEQERLRTSHLANDVFGDQEPPPERGVR